jgi:hypothetical protein
MMTDIIAKAEKKYRNKIADYLSSDEYQVTGVAIESSECVMTPECDADFYQQFTGLDVKPYVQPETLILKIQLNAKSA